MNGWHHVVEYLNYVWLLENLRKKMRGKEIESKNEKKKKSRFNVRKYKLISFIFLHSN